MLSRVAKMRFPLASRLFWVFTWPFYGSDAMPETFDAIDIPLTRDGTRRFLFEDLKHEIQLPDWHV